MAAVAIGLGLAVALLALFPLVVPLPPLRDALPPEELAGPDGRFVEVNGVRAHCTVAGDGEPGFLLLHGFGGSTLAWRELVPTLARWGKVVAFDRPGFGLTARPLRWEGSNPYGAGAQAGLALGLADALGLGELVVVAHSAGADTALRLALAWHDPSRLAPDVVAGYARALRAEGWDRGLWEVTIADCGHVPHEERPDAVLGAIAAFLAREGLVPEGR